MPHVTESTPLLLDSTRRPPSLLRRRAWPSVLAGALTLGIVCYLQHQPAQVDTVPDVLVSLDATASSNENAVELAFQTNLETFKDPTVDPCVDFYQYACGGWLKTHAVPTDRPSIDSSFYVVSETTKATIAAILARNPPQIGPLYHSCLSGPAVDPLAVNHVAKWLDDVHRVNTTADLMTLAGQMDQSLGLSTFFSWSVGADPTDPTRNVVFLSQGGLTLPSRDYYLDPSKAQTYTKLYIDYVTKVFAVPPLDQYNASEFADAVWATETSFATIALPLDALRDPLTTTTAYPFAEIASRYPFLMAYLNGINEREAFPMLHAIVATPKFFEAQTHLLHDDTLLPQLKDYVSFRLVDSMGALLGEDFRRASHDFYGAIQGTGTLVSRDEFCVQLTTGYLGDEVGKYYMQQVFGPDAKAAAQALVKEVEEALKALLLTESWLDKLTYEAAVQKLNNVKNYIGGPDTVPPLPFELQADTFFENVKKLLQFNVAETIRAINQPVDKQAWDMFPSTVDAYYDLSANKMVFPAAILQPPFYSAEHFPAAANFARIGMVMGHELSHGFDDQGRNYDANGRLRSWWTPAVSQQFTEKTQCLANQYSSFPVVSSQDGHVLGNVNGNLTLGENIADNGGIRLAYEAYHLWRKTVATPPVVPPNTTPLPPAKPMGPDPVKPIPGVLPPTPIAPASTPEPAPTKPEEDTLPPKSLQPPKPQPAVTEPDKGTPNNNSPAPVPEQPRPLPVPVPPPQRTPDQTPASAETVAPTVPIKTSPPVKSPETPPTPVPTPPPAIVSPPEPAIKQTPAPQPSTHAPAVNPPPPEHPSPPPVVPHVPDTPAPASVPDIPHPHPPAPTPPPAIVPPPEPAIKQTPAPQPPTHAPAVNPPPSEHPSPPPVVPHVPDTPAPASVPDVPHPHPPAPTPPPAIVPPPEPASKQTPAPQPPTHAPAEHPLAPDHSTSPPIVHHVPDTPIPAHVPGTPPPPAPTLPPAIVVPPHPIPKPTPASPETKFPPKIPAVTPPPPAAPSSPTSVPGTPTPPRVPELPVQTPPPATPPSHEKPSDEPSREPIKHEPSGKRDDESKHDDRDSESDKRGDSESKEEDAKRAKQKHSETKNEHDKTSHDDDKDAKEKHDKERKKDHEDERYREEESHRHKKHHTSEEEKEDLHEKKHRHDDEEEDRDRHEKHRHGKHKEKDHHGKHEHRKHESHKHERHNHHKHKHHEMMDWQVMAPKDLFSSGDVRVHSMAETLARALVQPLDPVADDRLFFTAFAQNWCEKNTPDFAELLRTIDPHAPGKWRVNGPLMNYQKFAETFSCPVGSPMNPEKKCIIW